jgi:hypothetical protein
MKKKFTETTKLKVIRQEVEKVCERNIRTKSRKREIVYARVLYYRLCKDLTTHSLSEIGSALKKDHATVLHGLKNYEQMILMKDKFYLEAYTKIYDKLKLNYYINHHNDLDLKTKYYKYLHQNIDLKNKKKAIVVYTKAQLKDIFSECRKEYGYVPQTDYLREKFNKIYNVLEKIS